jgi:predicted enzyme related to lactoylglutathione lyase
VRNLGKVVHFEIPAENVERAREFYKKAFGWKTETAPGMDYTLVRTTDTDDKGMPKEPGSINGGMMIRKAPVKNPVITIDVEDMEKALEEIKHLGGKIVLGKMPVGDMGFSAYFEDTEGNVVGLWQTARKTA